MIDADGFVLVQGVLDNVQKMANDTHDFIWAVRRALIMQCVLSALLGVITLLNWWMLQRTIRLMRDVLNLVQKLIDEHTR